MVDLGSVPPEAGHSRPEPEAVPIDRDALKLLASDTRLDILKALKHRRMTVSELATSLRLGKSTVFEHVSKLAEGGLIIRHDDPHREWVYYELSGKAKRLLAPSSAKIVLLFSTVVALGAAIAVVYLLASAPATSPIVAEVDRTTGLAGATEEYTVHLLTPDGQTAAGDYRLYLLDDAARDELVTKGQLVDVQASDAPSAGGTSRDDVVWYKSESSDGVEGRGVLLDLQADAEPDASALKVRAALGPGTYYLYAASADGARDNKASLVALDVEPAVAEPALSPLLVGADDGRVLPVWLSYRNLSVPEAKVRAVGAASAVADTDADGVAQLTLGALREGTLRFQYSLPPHPFNVTARGEVPVVRPVVVVDALAPAAGNATTVSAIVFDSARGAVEGAPVSLVSADARDEALAAGITDKSGRATLTWDASADREYEIRVGHVRFAVVTPALPLAIERLPANSSLGDVVRVTADGEPVPGASVYADGRLVGETGADGVVHVPETAHALRAAKADASGGRRYLDARHGDVETAPALSSYREPAYHGAPRFAAVPLETEEGAPVLVTFTLSATRDASLDLELRRDSAPIARTSASFAAGETRTVAFVARAAAEPARVYELVDLATGETVAASAVPRTEPNESPPPAATSPTPEPQGGAAGVPAPGAALLLAAVAAVAAAVARRERRER